jgi:nucleotide-binding universal stress UspA family protein
MTRVLVAVDDSEASVQAAETAHRLFGDGAEYLAVNVTNIVDMASIPWYGAGYGTAYAAPYGTVWTYRSTVAPDSEGGVDGGQMAEDQARQVAEQSGLPDAEPVGEEGDPVDAVLRAADEHQVDVIVVGAHERGWFDRLVRPSVSKEILKQAKVPVLVVH